jgi:ankyrin repeat protein
MKQLINDGRFDINGKDKDSWTPLHYAATYGYMEIIMILIRSGGVDFTIKNKWVCVVTCQVFALYFPKKLDVEHCTLTSVRERQPKIKLQRIIIMSVVIY